MALRREESCVLVHDWPGRAAAVLYFLSVGVVILRAITQPEAMIYTVLINAMFLFLFGWSILASIHRIRLWRKLASQ